MEFNTYTKKDKRNLVKNFFVLQFPEQSIPFKTIILPLEIPALIYIFDEQKTIIKNTKSTIKNLLVFGQFYGAYDYHIDIKSYNLGINFKPTALYKILNKDVSLYTDKHVLLQEINSVLNQKFEPIFIRNKNNVSNFIDEIILLLDSLEISTDKDLHFIDIAVDYILEKEGMVLVNELLDILPFSQKSLEIKFKKFVGLTPVKYIKKIRFIKLMTKYQDKKIDIKDLIYMYNYYDHSHFYKDFKLFMKQSPKLYFNQDYPLIEKYLKN